MKRERKRRTFDAAQLEMTPMIDVVFQLLIFFVVTLKQEDILSRLDVNRPAGESVPVEEKPIQVIEIQIHEGGFILQKSPVDLEEIDRQLSKIGSKDMDASVVIKCTSGSPHRFLVQVLDKCAKAGLANIAVFSM